MNFIVGNGDKWWKLVTRIDRELGRVSDDLSRDHGRSLSLGSPVNVGGEMSDQVRAPIILRGGPREFPVCYVLITEIDVDGRRLKALADRALALAQDVMNIPPHEAYTRGQETTFTYP